jgi:hypothetical protein
MFIKEKGAIYYEEGAIYYEGKRGCIKFFFLKKTLKGALILCSAFV